MFKFKIRYKLNEGLTLTRSGAYIDLTASEQVVLDNTSNNNKLINLGICVELPKYIKANIIPRSSLYISTRAILANSIGLIDPPIPKNRIEGVTINTNKLQYGYIGDTDYWKANLLYIEPDFNKVTIIQKGERICQFELSPVMDAPWWIWLKWIFKKGIKLEKVAIFGNRDRQGHGSSGKVGLE